MVGPQRRTGKTGESHLPEFVAQVLDLLFIPVFLQRVLRDRERETANQRSRCTDSHTGMETPVKTTPAAGDAGCCLTDRCYSERYLRAVPGPPPTFSAWASRDFELVKTVLSSSSKTRVLLQVKGQIRRQVVSDR